MHMLKLFDECLLVIDGIRHHMTMTVHDVSRRYFRNLDHVVVRGNFEQLKENHNLHTNGWLEFTIDKQARSHGSEDGYYVVFNVKKLD